MTFTYTGLAGPLAADKWSKMMRWATSLAGPEFVNAMAPTLPTGTRLVRVDPGFLVAAGVMVESDANEDVTLANNGGANPRIDIVVAEIDWSTDTADVKAIEGTNAASPVPPALTRDAGGLWHVPIARVLVRPGVGQLLASDLTEARPGRRIVRTFGGGIGSTTKTGEGEKVVYNEIIPDPGYDYRLQIYAACNFGSVDVGHGRMQIKVDGSTLRDVASGNQNSAPASAFVTGGVRSQNDARVQITISRQGMNGPLDLFSAGSYVDIATIPA